MLQALFSSRSSSAHSPDSDESETFSTPPSTPTMSSGSSANSDVEPTNAATMTNVQLPLSRRSSRPSSLRLDSRASSDWTPDVLLEVSPDVTKVQHNANSIDRAVGVAPKGNSNDVHSHSGGPEDRRGRTPGFGSRHNTDTVTVLNQQQYLRSPTHFSPFDDDARPTRQSRTPVAGNRDSHSDVNMSKTNGTTHNEDSHRSTNPAFAQRQELCSTPNSTYTQPMKSPCFVHSYLDKGASLADWLKGKKQDVLSNVGSSGSLEKHPHSIRPLSMHNGDSAPSSNSGSSMGSPLDSYYDEEDNAQSLTRQLAETAVGVREMSKQLGRARVRSNIQNVLIITKARDNRLIKLTRELALYLMKKPRYGGGRGLVVYVDSQLRHSKRFDAEGIEREYPQFFVPYPRRRSSSSISLASMASNGMQNGTHVEFNVKEEGQLRYWTSDMCNRSPELFDFVVTLGGDGTVLFTSWLFQRIVPPVLSFALGSLGFLTNFDFADHEAVMDSAIDNGIRVNLRMRFTCTVYRAVAPEEGKGRRAVKKADTGEIMMKNLTENGGWEALEGGWSGVGGPETGKCSRDKEIMCFTTRPVECFEVLNDLVVDRGPSPYVSLLELFGDEHHMTTVQADGLCISTPTGSTAYSLSAGGSLVHPEIPAILITPLCPHTLSFRPMLLPDSMELRICVPYNSRSTAWASFDGRGRVELKQGDHIKVTASKYPFPTVCADKQSTDWFHAISRTLKWNERERQKSFVVVEEGPARPKRSKQRVEIVDKGIKEEDEEDEGILDEEDEVSDEEEKFDIDDSSPQATSSGPSTEQVAKQKAKIQEAAARDAALALSKGLPALVRSRNRSRSRGGIDSPDRFAGAHPHPPKLSPRHVSFSENVMGGFASSGSQESIGIRHDAENGDRDHIHSPQLLSGGRSRIPKDRDVDAESMKTPTAADGPRRTHSRTNSKECGGYFRRAFAVFGQDESDSNASDGDL